MKCLLDTNAYVAFVRGDKNVKATISHAEHVYLSTVALGELLFGFRHGTRFQENLDTLTAFAGRPRVSVVPVSRTTADRYSRIAVALRRKGKPIPSNDIWIAAHAMETGADLLSFDEHFAAIDGLAWVNPGK